MAFRGSTKYRKVQSRVGNFFYIILLLFLFTCVHHYPQTKFHQCSPYRILWIFDFLVISQSQQICKWGLKYAHLVMTDHVGSTCAPYYPNTKFDENRSLRSHLRAKVYLLMLTRSDTHPSVHTCVHIYIHIISILLQNCNYKQNTENATYSSQSRRQVLNLITSKKWETKLTTRY